tara:strand:+ start:327 stop:578 length:252 start_codon:yes stop_codon:yes gene_type:complete
MSSYSLRRLGGQRDITGLTLYGAQKALQQAAQAGRLPDAAGVYRDGRFVAFWCEWRSVVRPGCQANNDERGTVLEDGPFLATL